MGVIVVGVADCHISDNPNQVLAACAPGSSVAVAIQDAVIGTGGAECPSRYRLLPLEGA